MTCANHGADGCCSSCVEGGFTDGYGFPMPGECLGRRGLQLALDEVLRRTRSIGR